MSNSAVIQDLILLDFNKSRIVYSFRSGDFEQYEKKSIDGVSATRVSGYAIEHKQSVWGGKKILYALFVQNDKIYFLAGSQCFDVTSDDNFISRTKVGFLKYRLTLKSKDREFFSVDYWEFTETQPDDMDSHFFVDTLHWLKNSETKRDLVHFWRNQLNHSL